MSDIECKVVKMKIEAHPDADRIEIALVGGYRSIIQKGQFKTGDLAVYIPEWAIIPDDMLREMGLEGRLAGKQGNRVNAIKLRGVVSQGLLYPAREGWTEGLDVADELGIIKYVAPIPMDFEGKVLSGVYSKWCFKYDIKNIKAHPDLFEVGEQVSMTEKLHGTYMVIGLLPNTAKAQYGVPSRFFLGSKRMFAKGITFDLDASPNNVYVRAATENDLFGKMLRFDYEIGGMEYPLYLMGEVYGVQDLKYGANSGKLGYRAFDIARLTPDGLLDYADDELLEDALGIMGIERVPVLYKGAFSWAELMSHTNGLETLTGGETHMREGVVVKSLAERLHPLFGRAIIKSVSDDYLLRHGGTEFN